MTLILFLLLTPFYAFYILYTLYIVQRFGSSFTRGALVG